MQCFSSFALNFILFFYFYFRLFNLQSTTTGQAYGSRCRQHVSRYVCLFVFRYVIRSSVCVFVSGVVHVFVCLHELRLSVCPIVPHCTWSPIITISCWAAKVVYTQCQLNGQAVFSACYCMEVMLLN